MPYGAKRWREKVRQFVREKGETSDYSATWLEHVERDLLRFPLMLRRAGVGSPPTAPTKIAAGDVLAYKRSPIWRATTKKPALCALRQFVAWSGSALASDRALWALPSGRAERRRWLTAPELAALYDASTSRGRVRVALQGFNGLRECEVLRLRVRDLDLGGSSPCVVVHGKGRHGGKYRTVPLTPTAWAVLREWVEGRSPEDRVYPVGHAVADGELAAAGVRAGLARRVSGHDLRRSFGRIGHRAGVPLVTLAAIYGHESVEQTAYYVGADMDDMASGLERFDRFVRAAPRDGAEGVVGT